MIYLYTKPRDGVKYIFNRPMGWCAVLSGFFNLPCLGSTIAALTYFLTSDDFTCARLIPKPGEKTLTAVLIANLIACVLHMGFTYYLMKTLRFERSKRIQQVQEDGHSTSYATASAFVGVCKYDRVFCIYAFFWLC